MQSHKYNFFIYTGCIILTSMLLPRMLGGQMYMHERLRWHQNVWRLSLRFSGYHQLCRTAPGPETGHALLSHVWWRSWWAETKSQQSVNPGRLSTWFRREKHLVEDAAANDGRWDDHVAVKPSIICDGCRIFYIFYKTREHWRFPQKSNEKDE